MKRLKVTKPMRAIRQNYWQKGGKHAIPRWLDKKTKVINPKPMQIKLRREHHDTDLDGVPNFQDCNIWNPDEQGRIHEAWNKVKSKVTRKPYYSEDDSTAAQDIKTVGKDVVRGAKVIAKAGAQFSKDVFEEAKQLNPENRPGRTQFFYVWVRVNDRWQDSGHVFQSYEEAYQIAQSLKIKGAEVQISDKLPSAVRQNVREGLQVRRTAQTPVAHVMIHQPAVQQPRQRGSPNMSSFGYSPTFVGATRKRFRVGGDSE